MKLTGKYELGEMDLLCDQIGEAGWFLGYRNEDRDVYELAHRALWLAGFYNAHKKDVKKVAKKIIKVATANERFSKARAAYKRELKGHKPESVVNW